MKIGIDARFYGTKQRGIGRYVKKLVDGMVKLDHKNEYVIFLREENFDEFKTANSKVKKALLDVPWYSLTEQLHGHHRVRNEQLDLMHWPHLNVPFWARQPYILTIHDLIINRFPDSRSSSLPKWLYWLKVIGYRRVVARAVRRAAKIIAPSTYVKNDLIKTYHLPADRIQVIYEGYFLEPGQQIMAITHFKITKPFILYVGSAYPHKNLQRLLRVFKRLNRDDQHQLVLAGRRDFFMDRLKKDVAHDPNVIFTGFVSDSELAALYQQARLYVFPSLYEGFGLPPIEAQAHGLVVASSSSSCLPEVLGKSAFYFDPNSDESMLAALQRCLTDKRLRNELAILGLKNISRYDWRRMVKETHSLYLSAMS